MSLTIIIIIALVVIIPLVIFFKVIKGIIKTLFSVIFILLLILVIIGIMVYFDTSTLNAGMENKKNIYLMEDNDLIVGASTSVTDIEDANLENSEMFSTERLEEDNDKYFGDEPLLAKNLVVMEHQFSELIIIIEKDYLIDDKMIFDALDQTNKTGMMLKAFAERYKEEKSSYIIEAVVERNIIIHPDFDSFKILRYLPGFIRSMYY